MLAQSRVINHTAGSVICRTLYPYPREVLLACDLPFVTSAHLTSKGCHGGFIILYHFTLKPHKHLVIGVVLLSPFFESSIRDLSLLPLFLTHYLVSHVLSCLAWPDQLRASHLLTSTSSSYKCRL